MYQVTASQTEQNIKLISCVKKHRCLFDHNDQNYKNSVYVDKGWQEVSKEFGESVSDCKKKWRHLRSSLSRYLKSSKDLMKNKNNKLKPYYLLQQLDFLVPYTKTLDNSKMDSIKYETSENNESYSEMKTEEDAGYDHEIIQEESQSMEDDEDIVYEAYEIQEGSANQTNPKSQITLVRSHANNSQQPGLNASMPQLQPLISTMSTPKAQSHTVQLNSSQISQMSPVATQNQSQISHQTTQQIPIQNTLIPITDGSADSADLNFFLALLPDVRNMNQEQKRKLRIGILKLIDDIMVSNN